MKLAEIGKKICELRNEMNLTQGELADGICTQALISLIERGNRIRTPRSFIRLRRSLAWM
ncbi:helix-turn-helix domain-containing protein [Rossellomorea sp. H39__3]